MFCIRTSLVIAAITGALAAPAATAMTSAGVLIENTATAEFFISGHTETAQSNHHTIRVDEIIRFEISSVARAVAGMQPLEQTVYAFDVLNAGNGTQCFSLTAAPVSASSSALEIVGYAADRNGDGKYDPAVDTALPASACGPELAPGQALRVFVIARMPASAGADGSASIAISVNSSNGAAPAGTIFGGAGHGGGDAVVSTALDATTITFTATASRLAVSLEKSQRVSDDAGRTTAAPGEMITYALTVRATGEGLVSNAVISDPLPADVAYVPGSLQLDGVAQSDATDADGGDATDSAVQVRLAARAAPFVSLITFKAVVRQPSL